MTVQEFQSKINKEYLWDKYWNYIYAFLTLNGGFFIIYKLLLTKWAENFSISLFIFSLLFSFYLVYLGIIGFLRTPILDQIKIISNNTDIETNKINIFKAAKKLNLHYIPCENEFLIKFETKNFLFEKRDLILFVNDKGIYANIQQRNWSGPTFQGYNDSIKILEKLKTEIKRLQLT